MFEIKKVRVIPSSMGNGLKINDFEIGCARIVDAVDYEDVFTVGFKTMEDDKIFYSKTLEECNNYVLVIITKDGNVSLIKNATDVCNIFGLDNEDANMLSGYIGALANDRNLVYHPSSTDDSDGCMFFNNIVDNKITEAYNEGNLEEADNIVKSILSSPDYRAEYKSDSFIKMFLVALITACQDRYNKVNKVTRLHEVAEILSNIKYWNDGQLTDSSVLDIDDFFTTIKSLIKIK